ncbi:MAG: HAD family hydrolase [Bacilli bacterium]
MIKRIIFDVDDTLIPFRDEYVFKLYHVYKKYVDKDMKNIINLIVDITESYDKKCIYYNKEDYLKHINNYLDTDLSEDFINEILDTMKTFVNEEDKNIKSTLEYLSSKYELVVLTNWFKDVQVKRLESLGLLKYFKEIYTSDTIKRKPYKESFLTAIGNNKPEQCVMVGDSYNIDIKPAKELGLTTVYINEKNISDSDYMIKKIEELKNLF